MVWPEMLLLTYHSHQLSRPTVFHLSIVPFFSYIKRATVQPHHMCATLNQCLLNIYCCCVGTEDTKINKTVLTLKELTISHGEQTYIYKIQQVDIFHSFNKYLLIIHYLPGLRRRTEQRAAKSHEHRSQAGVCSSAQRK